MIMHASNLDKNKITSARKSFERAFLSYLFSFAALMWTTLLFMFLKNIFLTIVVPIFFVSLVIIKIIIIFRIRYVCQAMGKGIWLINLFQFCIFISPLVGDIIIPMIVLSESKKQL
ncbi:MAG: hypothetical protein P9L93_00045 [Candidatus Gorgyraea atricola]|nr:hypothetical protein [Candidatus Gorgyraea atricola]